MKPGTTTSEFWVGLVAPLGAVVAAVKEMDDTPTRVAAIAGGTLIVLGYIWSRTVLKREEKAG